MWLGFIAPVSLHTEQRGTVYEVSDATDHPVMHILSAADVDVLQYV